MGRFCSFRVVGCVDDIVVEVGCLLYTSPEAVGIEKQMLKKAREDEINDKRLYCLHQANREFFGDSPAGVRQEGYLEEMCIRDRLQGARQPVLAAC